MMASFGRLLAQALYFGMHIDFQLLLLLVHCRHRLAFLNLLHFDYRLRPVYRIALSIFKSNYNY